MRFLKHALRDALIVALETTAASALYLAGRIAPALTLHRFAHARPRSLWGVTPILTLPLLAQCDRLLGVSSRSLVFSTYNTSRRFDIDLERWTRGFAPYPRALQAFSRLVLAWALLDADIFHYFYDRGILPPVDGRFGVDPEELRILKAAGKRVYFYAYGADVRTRTETLDMGGPSFCGECPTPGAFCICDSAAAAANMARISSVATAMLSMADMVPYVPGARNLHYWPIDVNALPFVGVAWRGERPLRILHAPNHQHFKGTRHLLAAVDQLKSEGIAVDLRLVSGVSNAEVLAAMSESDLVADQFIGGAHGYTAIEAWALGKPVITNVRDPSTVADWAEFPGINAGPDTLIGVLRELATGRRDLVAIGVASRRYAERRYSLEAIAVRLADLYLDTAEFGDAAEASVRKRAQALRVSIEDDAKAPSSVESFCGTALPQSR